jgi:hypothetical protein
MAPIGPEILNLLDQNGGASQPPPPANATSGASFLKKHPQIWEYSLA